MKEDALVILHCYIEKGGYLPKDVEAEYVSFIYNSVGSHIIGPHVPALSKPGNGPHGLGDRLRCQNR